MEGSDEYPALPALDDPYNVPPPHPIALEYAHELDDYLREKFRGLSMEFDRRYMRWQFSWRLVRTGFGTVALVNRKGGSVTERRRFEALCELGGKIIPFLVEKMTTKALAPAVVLYNFIEENNMYKVDPLDESNCMAQRQANLIIELNVVRNMTFNQSVSYWRIWYTVSLPPGTVFMADIDATRSIWFRNVVRMGEGIISRIMTSYLANPNEPWHQFLGAIVYDMVYDLDEETLDRAELYETWRRWYEEQEGAVMVLGYSTEDEDE